MVKAIVGANWGDEGKGKITDVLAADSSVVVRFQGGSNAGHTIVNQHGRFALHQLPSGVFYPHVTNVIGNGVALDLGKFVGEICALREAGVEPRLLVSDRVQLVMPYHVLFDQYEEERLGGRSFGSTKSGIAPFYADKFSKIGFQFSELFHETEALEKLKQVLEVKNVLLERLYHKPVLDAQPLFDALRQQRDQVAPYVGDTFQFLLRARKQGEQILLEGQLGAMKDPDFGIYPMVTSSSTLAGYGAVGAGIPPYEIQDIICVVKAYSSAVGAGAFVSEIFGEQAQTLRLHGGDKGEFGATTGRPRRMGWFDAVATRYGVQVQGATQVALTVLDALGYLEKIPVCVGYRVDGKVLTEFPTTPVLERCEPVLETLPGWNCPIRGITSYQELPKACRNYVEFIEGQLGVPITMVSNGPGRSELIYRRS